MQGLQLGRNPLFHGITNHGLMGYFLDSELWWWLFHGQTWVKFFRRLPGGNFLFLCCAKSPLMMLFFEFWHYWHFWHSEKNIKKMDFFHFLQSKMGIETLNSYS